MCGTSSIRRRPTAALCECPRGGGQAACVRESWERGWGPGHGSLGVRASKADTSGPAWACLCRDTNVRFSAELRQLQSLPKCERLPLPSFLLLPFQRITRLRMLLQVPLPGPGVFSTPSTPLEYPPWGLLPGHHCLPPHHKYRAPLNQTSYSGPLSPGPTKPCLELPKVLQSHLGSGNEALARDRSSRLGCATNWLADLGQVSSSLSGSQGECGGWSSRSPQPYLSLHTSSMGLISPPKWAKILSLGCKKNLKYSNGCATSKAHST